jgi:methylated-DNA-[protein]-cysteine S-methyltransferase
MSTELRERTVLLAPELGLLRLVASDDALVGLHFVEHHRPPPPLEAKPLDDAAKHDVVERTVIELAEYLAGARTTFSIPLAPKGTDFQREVWAALRAIPFGVTRSYDDLARAVGRPRAVRAVGAANGRNPLGIVVPCPRVVGKDGTLTGYAGGLPKKAYLLALEGRGRASSRAATAP